MAVFVITGIAGAATFMIPPFPQWVGQNNRIILGVAGQGRADWGEGPDGTRRIYTYTDITIEEVLRGEVRGRSIRVRQPGGEVDGVGMVVSGAAEFGLRERVVLMLGPQNPDRSYDVQSMGLGKLTVIRSNGREVLRGMAVSDEQDLHGEEHEHGGQVDTKGWTLDGLRELIRTVPTGGAESKPPSLQQESPVAESVNDSTPESTGSAPTLQGTDSEPVAFKEEADTIESGKHDGGSRKGAVVWLIAGVVGSLLLVSWFLRKR